jgi:hypothetical protein
MSGRRSDAPSVRALVLAVGAALAVLRCGSSDTNGSPAIATGGAAGASGVAGSSGGASAGGSVNSGGAPSSGGFASSGGVAGSTGSGGAPAAGGAATSAGGALPDTVPARTLAETGLYSDAAQTQLAADVTPYEVRYQLWADGATKKRYLYLPAGQKIDTTDPDAWVFPIGTKVWKEFTRDGTRVETRLIQKTAEGQDGWKYVAFAWNAAQTEAVAVPLGQTAALGTAHDPMTAQVSR